MSILQSYSNKILAVSEMWMVELWWCKYFFHMKCWPSQWLKQPSIWMFPFMVGIVNISTILSLEIPSKHILLAGEWAYLLYQWSKPIVFWRRQKKILNYENERLYVQSKENGIVYHSIDHTFSLVTRDCILMLL